MKNNSVRMDIITKKLSICMRVKKQSSDCGAKDCPCVNVLVGYRGVLYDDSRADCIFGTI